MEAFSVLYWYLTPQYKKVCLFQPKYWITK